MRPEHPLPPPKTDQDITNPQLLPLPNFEVGNVLGTIFSTFFRTYFHLMFLGLFALIPLQAILYLPILSESYVQKTVLTIIELSMLISVLPIMVLAVHDFIPDRSMRIVHYFRTAFRCYVPMQLLGMVNLGLSAGGMLFFVIPGLYYSARCSVVIPAIVIEHAGFKASARSEELTQNYRWPIVGVLSITAFVFFLMPVLFTSIRIFVVSFVSFQYLYYVFIISYIFETITKLTMMGFFSVVVVSIYERLRELTENASLEIITDVFD